MNKIHLSIVNSTNTYLKENYKELDNLTFVSTDEQTHGRGRNLRNWKSENGKNLLFSLLILDKELIKHYKELSIISALTICQIIEEMNISDVSIKWPNDVYIKDKKICGILLEALTKDEIECLIIGVGLNVNQDIFEGEYIIEPTSLKNELNKDIDINELKEKVYSKLIYNINSLSKDNNFYEYISKHDYLKSRKAYALINDSKQYIKIIGINKDYSLKIKQNDKEIDIESGEISFHI